MILESSCEMKNDEIRNQTDCAVEHLDCLTFTPIMRGILAFTSGPNHFFLAASVHGPHAITNASASIVLPSSSLTPHTVPSLSNNASTTLPITSLDPTDC